MRALRTSMRIMLRDSNMIESILATAVGLGAEHNMPGRINEQRSRAWTRHTPSVRDVLRLTPDQVRRLHHMANDTPPTTMHVVRTV